MATGTLVERSSVQIFKTLQSSHDARFLLKSRYGGRILIKEFLPEPNFKLRFRAETIPSTTTLCNSPIYWDSITSYLEQFAKEQCRRELIIFDQSE